MTSSLFLAAELEGDDLRYCGGEARYAGAGGGKTKGQMKDRYQVPPGSTYMCVSPGVCPCVCVGKTAEMKPHGTARKAEATRLCGGVRQI